MKRTTKLGALVMASLLVLTALAPAAIAAQTSGNVAVATDPATGVGEESATLNGNVTELDGNATVYFTYWVEGDDANETTTTELEMTSTGDFSVQVDDLEENTTYVYVAHAETDNESAVGSTQTFTTAEETELEVETDDADSVTNSSAENATVHFTYWAEGDEANNTTTASQTLEEPGDFAATVDGLENNTTYYYQAYAASGDLSDEGDVESFTPGADDEVDDESVSVTTDGESNVTNTSATLHGEVEGLGDDENATVYFTYWVEGDEENATDTANETVESDTKFKYDLTGLQNNTTYVYVAKADVNNTTYSGGEVTFTTGAENESEDEDDEAFGMAVSAFVHSLLEDRDGTERGIGQQVSAWVTANNPGADKRPDHAGPKNKDDKERGPPEHAGGPDKTDKDRGPPEHAGGPDASTSDDDDEDEDEEEEEEEEEEESTETE